MVIAGPPAPPPECTYSASCATRAAADRLTSKWVGLIVFCLMDRPHQFGALHRRIEGVSRKVLAQSLRSLERDGLVLRSPDADGATTTVLYSLTALGESFALPLTAFYSWMEAHTAVMESEHVAYDTLHPQ